MNRIEYFKLQAKNLYKDFKTQKPSSDKDILYDYTPNYFYIDQVILDYDIDEAKFSLMKAQHIIALMVGFNKWDELISATDIDLEVAKLLFDNQDKISIDEWDDLFIISALSALIDGFIFVPGNKLKMLQHIIAERKEHQSQFFDYRIHKK